MELYGDQIEANFDNFTFSDRSEVVPLEKYNQEVNYTINMPTNPI